MPTYTTNYQLAKPLVNDPTDQDQWGGELNADLDTIDGLLLKAVNTVTSTKAAAYTVVAADNSTAIELDATSAAFTVTLLPAATAGNGFLVGLKKIDATTNAITIQANGTELIDGINTFVLPTQYFAATLISDGTKWNIVSNNSQPVATNAQALSGTDTIHPVTSAGLASLKSLSANGYYGLPGGLIVQWGYAGAVSASNTVVTFPTAFPNSCLWALADLGYVAVGVNGAGIAVQSFTATTVTLRFAAQSGSPPAYWIAIGY